MIATDGRPTIANAPRTADFNVRNEGTIYLLQPLTTAGKQWIEEHVDTEHALYFGRSLSIDHRCIVDLVDGIFDAGLTIE